MSDLDDPPRRPAAELRRIIRYQRWVMAVLLAELALWIGYLVIGFVRGAPIAVGLRFPTVLSIILGGVGGIYTFLLYWTVRGPFMAIIMGVAALPPALGAIVLLIANGLATIRARHTCAHRMQELLAIVARLKGARELEAVA